MRHVPVNQTAVRDAWSEAAAAQRVERGSPATVHAIGLDETLDYLISRADDDGNVLVERPQNIAHMLGLTPGSCVQHIICMLLKAGILENVQGDGYSIVTRGVGAYRFADAYLAKPAAKVKAAA